MRSVGGSIDAAPFARRGSEKVTGAGPAEAQSRALITLEAPASSDRPPRNTRHPAAGFLAQLIATQMQAPQTRARRRAEHREATTIYRSMTKPVSCRRILGMRA